MKNLKKYVEKLKLSSKDFPISFVEKSFTALRQVSALEVDEQMIGDEAYINFKGLTSFVAGISKDRQEDVLNSLLIAQRAAQKSFPDENQVAEWYKKYYELLTNLGWVFETKEFSTFDADSTIFEVEKVILEIIGVAITANQLALLLKTIEAIKAMGDHDSRFVAFEKNTHTLQKGSFQLGVATEVEGKVSLFSSCFIISSSNTVRKILFFSSKKEETTFEFSLSKATLNDAVYGTIRDLVKTKLGADVNNYISNLDI
jgi:hypothetical protein